MPVLRINCDNTAVVIPFTAGMTVRDILEDAGIKIRTGCRGNGACGLCLIGIYAGELPAPTRTESLNLSAEKLAAGIRLACQTVPLSDVRIELIGGAATTGWRELTTEATPFSPDARPGEAAGYGLAVDIGTTNINLSLWDLTTGRRLGGRVGYNPQGVIGADVISRLTAAAESAAEAAELSRLVSASIGRQLEYLADLHDIRRSDIRRVVVVGNTAMSLLFGGGDASALLQPANWTKPIACGLSDRAAMADSIGIKRDVVIELVPPLSGFVGADLIAGVISSRLLEQPGSMLIDFGTNSELALWDGSTLWVTSAAGGPAFEQSGTRCGMPAEPGAICGVRPGPSVQAFQFDVIGGGDAVGLCGTGFVDLLALLLDTRRLSPTGRLQPGCGDGITIGAIGEITVTKRDIDAFQRAKAAIGLAISTLVERSGLGWEDLNRLCIGGAFGVHLNIRNAQRVGLLPDIPAGKIQFGGNTALAGAEHWLLRAETTGEAARARRSARMVNLAGEADFDDRFLEHLYLQPIA
jgi:uncharacterized 2Fe-2S/4Fe-4S cluster protein (DUF4445 family)